MNKKERDGNMKMEDEKWKKEAFEISHAIVCKKGRGWKEENCIQSIWSYFLLSEK